MHIAIIYVIGQWMGIGHRLLDMMLHRVLDRHGALDTMLHKILDRALDKVLD